MRVQIPARGYCRVGAVAYAIGLATWAPGCGSAEDARATPAFMPSWPEARHALELVLIAWHNAPGPTTPSLDSTAVKLLDRQRKPGQRLLAFEILAQTDAENARQFTVRLKFEGEEKPQLVKYNILGRDPVWVFRLEDYENFAHWEMDMSDPKSGPIDRRDNSADPAKAEPTE
jgi:hypothetical protein